MDDLKQNQIEEFIVPDKFRIVKGINLIDKINENSVCLDIGIAIDGFGDTIQKKYKSKVYGIDIHDRSMSNFIETKKYDINKGLPYDNEFFDVITAGELIEHMYNDEFFLRECHRCLKENGELVITTPNIHFLVNRIIMLFGKMPLFSYCSFHYNIYNKTELVKKLERNGFKVQKVRASHILFSSRVNPVGVIFEWLADIFPTFGGHLIICAKKVYL